MEVAGDLLKLAGSDLDLTVKVEATVNGIADGVCVVPARLAAASPAPPIEPPSPAPTGDYVKSLTALEQQVGNHSVAPQNTGLGAFLLTAAAWGLAEIMDTGLAFLVVGVVFLAVAAGLGAQGKTKLARFSPVPQATVQTVKEDVETAKDSLQRGVNGPGQPSYSDAWGRGR